MQTVGSDRRMCVLICCGACNSSSVYHKFLQQLSTPALLFLDSLFFGFQAPLRLPFTARTDAISPTSSFIAPPRRRTPGTLLVICPLLDASIIICQGRPGECWRYLSFTKRLRSVAKPAAQFPRRDDRETVRRCCAPLLCFSPSCAPRKRLHDSRIHGRAHAEQPVNI